MKRLLTPSEVSELLGIPVATLAQWRYRQLGPISLSIGRHIRYREEDLESYLDERAAKKQARSGG